MELKSPEKDTEYKPEIDEKGNLVLKKKENIKRGSKSRSSGGQFELRVRRDLEEKGFIVDKWSNNVDFLVSKGTLLEGNSVVGSASTPSVDFEKGKIISAKRKFNPFNKVMTIGTGFPDFIAFQKFGDYYKIIGVEVKQNNKLSREEKFKCGWYLKNKIFNEIWVASKVRDGRTVSVLYEDFVEKWGKFVNE